MSTRESRHLLYHIKHLFGFRLSLCHHLFQVGNILAVGFVITFYIGNGNSHLGRSQLFLTLDFIILVHFLIFLDDGSSKLDGAFQCRRWRRNGFHPFHLFLFDFRFCQFRQGSHLCHHFFLLRSCQLKQCRDAKSDCRYDYHNQHGDIVPLC